jgi:O-antigen/teichoic acid export membrane protein
MLLIFIGRAVQFALLLLTLRLATGFLSPSEMGKVSIVTATVALFAQLLLNPVGMFMNRRLHAWDSRGQVKKYFAYFWRYLLVISLCSALTLVILIWLNIWNPSISIYWLLFLVCGNLIFTTVNQVVVPGLNMFGYRGWFVVLSVATVSTSLIFAVMLVQTVSPRAEYWLSGLFIGQLIVGLLGKKVFFGKLHHANVENSPNKKLSYSQLKTLMMFAWPVSIAVGLNWAQTQSYRFFMENSLGLPALGLFVAGYGISVGLIAGFESVFTTYFLPIFYEKVSGEDRIEQGKAWSSYASAILPSLLLVGCLVVAAAPELTRLMLAEGYKDSSQFVVWGAIAELARVATGVYGMVAHARMKTRLLIVPNAIGVVISITMILLLMPKYGAAGVGFALALAGISVFMATYIATRMELVTTLPFRLLIQGGVMGVALMVVASIARKIMGAGEIVTALMLLTVLAIVFLPTQYWILQSFVKGQK